MVHKFKRNFYTETEAISIRKGDLLNVGVTVGILRSEYDPDLLEIQTESGCFHSCTNGSEVKKLLKI